MLAEADARRLRDAEAARQAREADTERLREEQARLAREIEARLKSLFGRNTRRGEFFAVTLGLGIACSVFTAVYVTQLIIGAWFDWRRPKSITV